MKAAGSLHVEYENIRENMLNSISCKHDTYMEAIERIPSRWYASTQTGFNNSW